MLQEQGAEFTQTFAYEKKGNSAVIRRCFSRDTKAVIPEEIDGLPVTEIGAYAFSAHLDEAVFQKELAEGKQCGFQCGGGSRPSLHFVQPYSCRLTSKYPVRLCRVQCPVGYGQTRKGT